MLSSITKTFAQTPLDSIDINNVNALINPDGRLFNDGDNPRYKVPKSGNVNSMYNHALMIGGKDENGWIRFSSTVITANSFIAGPYTNIYDSNYLSSWNHVWKINKSTIDSFILYRNNPNYQLPSIIQNWPAHGDVSKGQNYYLAPFYDENNDGVYMPADGDYPLIKGDQAIWLVINDGQNRFGTSITKALNIQVQIMIYAYKCPMVESVNNSIFIEYTIENSSSFKLTDTYIGLFNDFDLGDNYDDLVGTEVMKSSVYAYNAFDTDSKYGNLPPAMAMTILKGIEMDSNSLDDPYTDVNAQLLCGFSSNGRNFGNGILDDERYGITSSLSEEMYIQNIYLEGEAAYYSLTAKKADGTPFYYYKNLHGIGGNGQFSKFQYPGNSDSFDWGTNCIPIIGPKYWTDSLNVNYYDAKISSCMGPFTLNKNQKKKFEIALIWAQSQTGNAQSSLSELMGAIKQIYQNPILPCSTLTEINEKDVLEENEELILYPNPVDQHLNILFQVNNTNPLCSIYSISGELLLSEVLSSGKTHSIDLNKLSAGMYIIIIQSNDKVISKKFIKE